MANRVYTKVAHYRSFAQNPSLKENGLFPAPGLLEFLGMIILGPLLKNESGNQHLIDFTERYNKLTRVIAVTILTRTNGDVIFVGNWLIPYGIPIYFLTHYGLEFVSKFFARVTACL